MSTGAPQPTPDTRIPLTPEEHTRAARMDMWILADRLEHDSEQLTLDYAPFAGIIGGRNEWAGAAQTARPVSTPTLDRSSYE